MSDFVRLLASVKTRRDIVPMPPIAETLLEMFERCDQANSKAEIESGMYFDLTRQTGFVVCRLPHHAFIRWCHGDMVRLIWMEARDEQPTTFWGTLLTNTELNELVVIRGIRGIEVDESFSFTATGLGPFLVCQLKPGDSFVDTTGRPGVVATLEDDEKKIGIVLNPHTIRAQRQLWPGHLSIFVPSIKVARRLAAEQRQARQAKAKELAVA